MEHVPVYLFVIIPFAAAGYEHMADVIAGITNDRSVEFSVRDWAASELTSLGREALAEQGRRQYEQAVGGRGIAHQATPGAR